MNMNGHFDEDDLLLYALRELPAEQASVLARRLAASPEARRRLAELETTLAVYAEASVEFEPVPVGSLDRLMQRVHREPKPTWDHILLPSADTSRPVAEASRFTAEPSRSTPVVPIESYRSPGRNPARTAATWAGWAAAAVLALTTGLASERYLAARQAADSQNSQLTALSQQADALRHEHDQLQAQTTQLASTATERAAQAQQAAAQAAKLRNQATAAQNGAAALQARLAQQSSQTSAAQNDLAALEAQLAAQTAQLNQQNVRVAQAEREQNRLQGIIAGQNSQLAQLNAQTRSAESSAAALGALTDPSALRVVLRQPKAKPAPTGRASYVANKGSLVFVGNNLAPLAPDRVYELWILPATGANPVPVGTFTPDPNGNAQLVLQRLANAVPAKGFAVTAEHTGGSDTPTLPILLAGTGT